MLQIDINTKAVVALTNRLEKIGKTALPKAIAYTLNSAAFDVKTKTMPKRSADIFEKRSPNFFKANSKVEKVTSNDLRSMKATVGFISDNLEGKKNNHAVKDLEQQEHGGSLGGKSFIPLDRARKGNSYTKAVRPNNRISKIQKVIEASKVKAKSTKQKFIIASLEAGPNSHVLSRGTLFRINSFSSNLRTKGIKINAVPLYSFKKSRKIRVRGTHFMEKSSIESAKKMEGFYIAEAKKRIARL
jgi:hypothetical protein